jgi:hypothetical protein
MVTRKIWSKDKVKLARIDPYCNRQGFSKISLEGGDARELFTITLGGCEFVQPRIVLRVLGEELLRVREPEAPGAPVRLSGRFYDRHGRLAVEIVDNEYRGRIENWDIETGRGRVVVRSASHQTSVDLRIHGRNHVAVRKLKMAYKGLRVRATNREVELSCHDSKIRFAGRIFEPECAIDIAAA